MSSTLPDLRRTEQPLIRREPPLTTESTGLWWRHRWMEAVYASDVKPLEVLVASIYADHAGDGRTAWVTLDRLRERSKLSRDAAHRALKGLIAKGFLVVVVRAKQHRATVYGLVIPAHLSSPGDVPLTDSSSPPHGPLSQSSSTPDDTSSTPHDTSSTGGVPNPISYPSSDPISLSREQELVADLLGLEPRDERLMSVQKMLDDNHVRNATAWLRTVARNDELFGLLELAAASPNGSTNTDPTTTATDRNCAFGCGPFVRWSEQGPRCRVCGELQFGARREVS